MKAFLLFFIVCFINSTFANHINEKDLEKMKNDYKTKIISKMQEIEKEIKDEEFSDFKKAAKLIALGVLNGKIGQKKKEEKSFELSKKYLENHQQESSCFKEFLHCYEGLGCCEYELAKFHKRQIFKNQDPTISELNYINKSLHYLKIVENNYKNLDLKVPNFFSFYQNYFFTMVQKCKILTLENKDYNKNVKKTVNLLKFIIKTTPLKLRTAEYFLFVNRGFWNLLKIEQDDEKKKKYLELYGSYLEMAIDCSNNKLDVKNQSIVKAECILRQIFLRPSEETYNTLKKALLENLSESLKFEDELSAQSIEKIINIYYKLTKYSSNINEKIEFFNLAKQVFDRNYQRIDVATVPYDRLLIQMEIIVKFPDAFK